MSLQVKSIQSAGQLQAGLIADGTGQGQVVAVVGIQHQTGLRGRQRGNGLAVDEPRRLRRRAASDLLVDRLSQVEGPVPPHRKHDHARMSEPVAHIVLKDVLGDCFTLLPEEVRQKIGIHLGEPETLAETGDRLDRDPVEEVPDILLGDKQDVMHGVRIDAGQVNVIVIAIVASRRRVLGSLRFLSLPRVPKPQSTHGFY